MTLFANAQNIQELRKKANDAKQNGNVREAVTLYTEIIEQLDEKDSRLVEVYGNRAYCNKHLGNYTIALTDYDKAIENASNKYQTILKLNKSDLLIILGLYSDAESILESISTNDVNIELHRIANLSTVYQCRGNFTKCIYFLNNVINRTHDRKTKSIALQNRAFAYMELAKDSILLSIHDFSEAISLMDPKSSDYFIVLSNKAIAEMKNNNLCKALEDINRSVDGLLKMCGSKHPDYQRALRKKALILQRSGDYKHSMEIYSSYISYQKKYVMNTFYDMSEQNRLDFWKTIKPNISEVFAFENYCPDFLLDVALFRREIALLGNADKDRIKSKFGINGQQLRNVLNGNEIALDFIRYQKNDTTQYGAIIVPSLKMRKPVKFIPLWTEEELHGYKVNNVLRLDSALCSNNMVHKDILYSDSLLSCYIWDKLDKELDKYDYEDVYFAPDGILHLLALEYLREDNGVCMHRITSLSQLLDRNKYNISFDNKMLAVGGLNYDDVQSERIEADVNHDAITQLRQYLESKNRNWDNPFVYLDGTRVEIDSISYYSPFNTDTTTVQTEKQLKEIIKNKTYKIIHLSTHGYSLDVDVPFVPEALRDSITEDKSLLSSGIALTSANVAYKNENSEDGIISAREFCELDMSNIDLMVLSACQTGLGRFSDEGPAGLVRGLKKAGAGSLIVSLWSVSDEATTLFMNHLYKAIREQSSPDIHAAFNAARLNFSKEQITNRYFDSKKMKTIRSKDTYNHPRFCNSFILIDAIK